MKIIFKAFFVLLLTLAINFADAKHLGQIKFITTGNPQALPAFHQGLLLLHSFEYESARTSFIRAETIDPDFALAYWGEAMTYNHPVWNEVDIGQAKNVLIKLKHISDERRKRLLPIEKLFINALDVLYGDSSKVDRDLNYTNAMRDIYRQYPDNDEAASFYALSLLGQSSGVRNERNYMKAAGIAEEIYQKNPCHPGALHYLIHSYDDPIHAPLGLRAARQYAQLAPDASHAIHMPSHIFLALGLWDDVIHSNKSAWQLASAHNSTKGQGIYTIDDLHAAEWLAYGYLQKRDYSKAYQLTLKIKDIVDHNPTAMSKWYYTFMRSAYVFERQDWQTDLPSVDLTHNEISARAADLYTNAMIELHRHGLSKQLDEFSKQLHRLAGSAVDTQTHKDYFNSVLPTGIIITKIMDLELQSRRFYAMHHIKQAEAGLKKAVLLEEQLNFGYGPPKPIQPAHEQLARLLIQEKKYLLAYQQLSIALERTPNRLITKKLFNKLRKTMRALNIPIPKLAKAYFNRLMLADYYH